jgi:hypothetical protein
MFDAEVVLELTKTHLYCEQAYPSDSRNPGINAEEDLRGNIRQRRSFQSQWTETPIKMKTA